MAASYYAGIDVSKKRLDVFYDGRARSVDNTPSEAKKLALSMAKAPVTLVAVEATGGYEAAMVDALQQAGIPVAVVQPSRVRAFAHAKNLLAKTDKLDAQLLANFAEQIKPTPTPPKAVDEKELRELVDRRDQLVADQTRETNRLESTTSALVRKGTQSMLRVISRQIKALEKEMARLVAESKTMKIRCETLQKAKGVGFITAATLIAHLPELGRVNRQEVAALGGLACHAKESGDFKGKRRVFGGRRVLRRALYMASLSAVMHDPVLKVVYAKLVAAGRPRKVALIACARRLLVYLNGQIKQALANSSTAPTPV